MNHFSIDGPLNEWIVLFHGTGGNEYTLLQIAGDIEPNASILTFLGDVGEGAERRYFKQLNHGQLQRQDFDERITTFLTKWQDLKPKEAEKITFMGYSNGANFILGLLEKQPEIADCIVLMHPSDLNYSFEKGNETQIVMTAGALDGISTPGDTLRLSKQLQEVFPNTTLKLLDGAHNVTDAEIEYLQQALAKN
ncbi:MAG: phospholipase [Kurthia sp.]|nr:phospholipase [Candidatus Kurthia equi]